MAQQTALTQVMSDIKAYVMSLDVPNNPVYQENEILILSCFKKAMEICEGRLAVEKEQIKNAVMYGLDEDGHTGDWKMSVTENYYNKTYKDGTTI